MPSKHSDPPIEWKLSIPESLAGKVDLLLWDPVRARVEYGARSKLVQKLLQEWLARGGKGS